MTLQIIGSLLTLGFGVLGLLVARRLSHPLAHRLAWAMAGTAFAAAGASKLSQNVFGTFALVNGPGSPTWNVYLEWAPLFDHGRTGMLATLFLLLAVLLVPHRSHAAVAASGCPTSRWMAALAAGAVAGMLAGWVQGWDNDLHFRNVAISDTAELLLVLASLLTLLLRERVDRLLWLMLSLYAANLAMNVMWMSAWMQTAQSSGTFSLTYMHVTRIVVYVAMVALAWRRLAHARRGTLVPGLLSSLPLRGAPARRMF